MTADMLDTHLLAYLSLREALGFQMQAEKILLPAFVAYVHARQDPSPIRTQHALEWACQASAHCGPSRAARRLSIARWFLRYLVRSKYSCGLMVVVPEEPTKPLSALDHPFRIGRGLS